jgi:hypothetical protein
MVVSHSALAKSLLPQNYIVQLKNDYLPPPLTVNCIESDLFNDNYKNPFNDSHLQLINSSYFGVQGIKKESLEKTPMHALLLESLPRRQDEVNTELSSSVSKLALQTCMTNFQNM